MQKTFLKLSASVLLISAFASNSYAATTSGTANARVVTPISVSAGAALQFGSFAASGTAGTINQAGTVTGGVTAISGGATRAAGTFTVTGENSANTAYTFTLPSTATLTNGANSMTATLTYSSGNGSRTLISGTDTVTVNGSLAVSANQAAGAYTGTYNVTAVY
jgi:Mat/Ecp fimbriae major subunit